MSINRPGRSAAGHRRTPRHALPRSTRSQSVNATTATDIAGNANLRAADAAAARLLREIDRLEARIERIASINHDHRNDYLIEAWRRELRVRRALLADLPKPIERVPDPWR